MGQQTAHQTEEKNIVLDLSFAETVLVLTAIKHYATLLKLKTSIDGPGANDIEIADVILAVLKKIDAGMGN